MFLLPLLVQHVFTQQLFAFLENQDLPVAPLFAQLDVMGGIALIYYYYRFDLCT